MHRSSVSRPHTAGLAGFDANREATVAGCLTALGLGLSITFGAMGPEGVLHFDDLTHYLYARWAWLWPAHLLDSWGRPGFTALYFLPAGLGWWACRAWSALLTAGTVWLAFRLAQRMGLRHAWAVVIFCYAQPLFFQLSQTTLTETALAFYLTSAVFLAQRGRWSWSAALISIGFVTRHEAVIFLPVWVYSAWRAGVKPWRLWPLLWAPLAVTVLSLVAGRQPAILGLFEPRPSGQYGRGGWLTFLCRSMEAWGPGVTVLAILGAGAVWRLRGGILTVGCIVAYFGAQTVIRALGLFDSGGYARFLVGISPLVGIAALAGWHQLWAGAREVRRRATGMAAGGMVLLWIAMERQLVLFTERGENVAELPELHLAVPAIRIATGAVVFLAMVSVVCGPVIGRVSRWLVPGVLVAMMCLASAELCHPLAKPVEAKIVEALWADLVRRGLDGREIISAHVWMDYATGRALPPDRPSVRRRLERAPVGTLLVWDTVFSGSADHGLDLDEFTQDEGSFRLVLETRAAPYQEEPYMRVFEKVGPWGRETAADAQGVGHAARP